MVFRRILASNRGVMYGDGDVLDIRPSGRGAQTHGKGGRAVADLISVNLLEVMAM